MFLGSSCKVRLTLILRPFQHEVVRVLEKESMGNSPVAGVSFVLLLGRRLEETLGGGVAVIVSATDFISQHRPFVFDSIISQIKL